MLKKELLSEWTRVSIKTKQTSPYRLWQKYMAPGSGSIKGNAWKSSRWNFIPVEIKPKLWKVKVASHVWLFAALWDIQSMEFSRPEYWSGQPFPSPGDHPNPGIEPRSPTSQAYSLPGKTPGKPQNTGVDSLFLLQWIFLTPELNQVLLHCRWILYQLCYQGSL